MYLWFKYTVTGALADVCKGPKDKAIWVGPTKPPTLVFKSEVGFIGSIKTDSVVETEANSDGK